MSIKEKFTNFINFLSKYNIIGFAIGLIFAGSIIEINNVIIDSIIMPSIEPLLKNNNYQIKIGSIIFDLEKLIKSIIKLFIFIFILFLLFYYGIQINLTTTIRNT